MYTVQALWTQARERLDVVTVIIANRSYSILNIELARVGAANRAALVLARRGRQPRLARSVLEYDRDAASHVTKNINQHNTYQI